MMFSSYTFQEQHGALCLAHQLVNLYANERQLNRMLNGVWHQHESSAMTAFREKLIDDVSRYVLSNIHGYKHLPERREDAAEKMRAFLAHVAERFEIVVLKRDQKGLMRDCRFEDLMALRALSISLQSPYEPSATGQFEFSQLITLPRNLFLGKRLIIGTGINEVDTALAIALSKGKEYVAHYPADLIEDAICFRKGSGNLYLHKDRLSTYFVAKGEEPHRYLEEYEIIEPLRKAG